MNTARELFVTEISSTSTIMLRVLLALIPGTLASIYFLGSGVLLNLIWAVLAALLFEYIAVRVRKRPAVQTLKDGSIVLAAVLFALALPPLMPFWQISIGVLAMVFLGKQLFGGLGQNPFNPAMVGYAVLLLSFPLTMTTWPTEEFIASLTLGDWMIIKLHGNFVAQTPPLDWDAITRATPLDRLNALPVNEGQSISVSLPWAWINAAFLVGGVYLLFVKTIRWHIPVSLLIAFCVLSFLNTLYSNTAVSGVAVSLFSGAMMLGAFFIATDPVTAAASPTGRVIYGAGIGVLVFVLRNYSAYPEGIAFAVLLMNLCVPAIDACTLRTGRVQ